MSYNFGENPDSDREALLKLHGKNLSRACVSNKYIAGICNNGFWQEKFIREYGVSIGYLDKIDYKDAYNSMYNRDLNEQLMWAAKNGYTPLVDELLNRGADIHAADDFAVKQARFNDHSNTVDLLISRGAKVYEPSKVRQELAFGVNPERDTEVFLNLNGKTLFSQCSATKYNSSLCNSRFWRLKFIKEYKIPLGDDVDYKKAYNQMYIRKINDQLAWAKENGYDALAKELVKKGAK